MFNILHVFYSCPLCVNVFFDPMRFALKKNQKQMFINVDLKVLGKEEKFIPEFTNSSQKKRWRNVFSNMLRRSVYC